MLETVIDDSQEDFTYPGAIFKMTLLTSSAVTG